VGHGIKIAAGNECSPLVKLKGDILRLKAFNVAVQQDFEQAAALLEESDGIPTNQQGLIRQRLITAKQMLIQGIEAMCSDGVFCVLQDSSETLPLSLEHASNGISNIFPMCDVGDKLP